MLIALSSSKATAKVTGTLLVSVRWAALGFSVLAVAGASEVVISEDTGPAMPISRARVAWESLVRSPSSSHPVLAFNGTARSVRPLMADALLAIRARAIAKGMRLLTLNEIVEELARNRDAV